MKRWLRWLLWKLCRRDYLVLNPNGSVITRTPDFSLIATTPAAHQAYLPVAYNYHTPHPWHLEYKIRGHGQGTLLFSLQAPGKTPFCQINRSIQLPTSLTLRQDEDQLLLNDAPIDLVPGSTVPWESPWLVASFRFQSPDGNILLRHTGHRVQSASTHESQYFEGAVYDDYESQAASFPPQILGAIQEHHPLTGRFLDVGCATGLLVEAALQAGLNSEGIDVSSWAVEKANQRVPGRCRVLNLDLAHKSDFEHDYDIIVLHSVIEHLENPSHALELLFQILNPGGIIYIQTLNASSITHSISGKDWCGYTDPTHQSPWLTADWLEDNSRQAGFEVLKTHRYGVWNDNQFDEVWKAFGNLLQVNPANTLLQDQFGDFVEIIIRKPNRDCEDFQQAATAITESLTPPLNHPQSNLRSLS